MAENAPFELKALENDMRRLAEEVATHRENPANREKGDLELLRASIRETPPSGGVVSAPPFPQTPPSHNSSVLPDYAVDASAETKLEIEYLLDTAFRKGIGTANAFAQKASPFVQDAYHDSLAGKLYPELVRRGLLK